MVKAPFSGFPPFRHLSCLILLAAAAACQSPPAGPAGHWSVPTETDARLSLPLDVLAEPARRARFTSDDGRYVEETAQWGGDPNRPRAGLRLSEASPGPPLTDPREPAAIVAEWTVLRDKRPAFAELQNGQNAYGPVSYWRTGIGTSVCALFVQRLPPRGDSATTLSGYYCNPQGLPLSPQAAATVVRRIGLRAPPKTP